MSATYEPMIAPFVGPHKVVGRSHTSLWGTVGPNRVVGQPYVFSATPMPWPSIQGRRPNVLRTQHGLHADDDDHQQDTKTAGGIILGGMALLAAYVLMK